VIPVARTGAAMPRRDGAPARGILAINAGSSSIKFTRFDAATLVPGLSGRIERIGGPGTSLTLAVGAAPGEVMPALTRTDHAGAAAQLIEWLRARDPADVLAGVGHRFVHGGPDYRATTLLTPAVVANLQRLTPMDPEHLPHEIALIELWMARFPGVPQWAAFDTAFHHDLPPLARLLPIPRRYAAMGVRRYGFHGLSYEFLMGELRRGGGTSAAGGRVILAHLGNGASLAAVRDGKPVDTSMAFTPAAGIPMGTRSGDLDPGLAWYLTRLEGMDAAKFNHMVNFESGLLGVSGTSADMRDLLEREAVDPCAAEAVGMFCLAVRKSIGAFAATLGGLDTLVFSGGIGANSAVVRERACAELGFLGIEIDAAQNRAGAETISGPGARVSVRVIDTDEELVIARAVRQALDGGSAESTQSTSRREKT
jgi:acetate kinase